MSTIKTYKPTTPARRKTSVVDYKKVITQSTPHKKLTMRKSTTAGRNSSGKITIRHRGGGNRRLIRIVSFKAPFSQGFKVNTIEYDPHRTAFICLVTDIATGKKYYTLYTKGMEVGKIYRASSEITDGNQVSLSTVPVGGFVSQIELQPGKGAQMIRSAGSYAIVTAKDEKTVTLKLPSGEIRKVSNQCLCIVGRVGNEAHEQVRLGKAGRVRNKGRRPVVRGKVMNPADHPHGGGEARNSIGMKYPKTKWGKHAMGVRTRNKKARSNKFIVTRRYNAK